MLRIVEGVYLPLLSFVKTLPLLLFNDSRQCYKVLQKTSLTKDEETTIYIHDWQSIYNKGQLAIYVQISLFLLLLLK